MKVQFRALSVEGSFDLDMPAAPCRNDRIVFREEEPSSTIVHTVIWTPLHPDHDVEVLGEDPVTVEMMDRR